MLELWIIILLPWSLQYDFKRERTTKSWYNELSCNFL